MPADRRPRSPRQGLTEWLLVLAFAGLAAAGAVALFADDAGGLLGSRPAPGAAR